MASNKTPASRSARTSGTSTPQQAPQRQSLQGKPAPPVAQTHTPAPPPPSNAWAAGGDRSSIKGPAQTKTSTASNSGRSTPGGTGSSVTAPPSGKPSTAAVGGFARAETRQFLKTQYQTALEGDTEKTARWKASGEAPASKTGGAWGPKPTTMANGRDFWTHLASQIAQREQGGGG